MTVESVALYQQSAGGLNIRQKALRSHLPFLLGFHQVYVELSCTVL